METQEKENIFQPSLLFRDFRISQINFSNPKPLRRKLPENLGLGLSYKLHFFKDSKKDFVIEFFVELSAQDEDFFIKLKADALFSMNREITEDDRKSQFILLNAPAIAFPYLRSFITTLSSNTGLPPIFLPPINFQKLKPDEIVEH